MNSGKALLKSFAFARNRVTDFQTRQMPLPKIFVPEMQWPDAEDSLAILISNKTNNKLKMKIAITSVGNSPDAKLDSHFGRCSYLVIYDTKTQSTEYIPNPCKENVEGAGPATARFVAARGVKKVVSGEFGGKVKSIFDSLQIQLVVLHVADRSVSDIIKMLNHN